ncbi:hypothetical protein E8E11_000064 [Didymella keratinophila]|nr:hypothetical protein E8E11_000064 [Didymella keratinophila]
MVNAAAADTSYRGSTAVTGEIAMPALANLTSELVSYRKRDLTPTENDKYCKANGMDHHLEDPKPQLLYRKDLNDTEDPYYDSNLDSIRTGGLMDRLLDESDGDENEDGVEHERIVNAVLDNALLSRLQGLERRDASPANVTAAMSAADFMCIFSQTAVPIPDLKTPMVL